MKITRTTDGTMTYEVEGDTHSDLFERLAAIEEVFEENTCGKCGQSDLRHVVRTVDDNQYFELKCLNKDCRAKLAFGQNKKGGGLFPKRKDEDGNWKGSNGWVIWNPKTEKEE